MDSIQKAISDNSDSSSDLMVSVNLGELRELTLIIRDQSLALEKELNKLSPRVDTIGAKQTQYRLKELFKQLTGIKV